MPVFAIIIIGNIQTTVCAIWNPQKPVESVLQNPVALNNLITKGDGENFNLIIVSSVCELKAAVMKGAAFSATFLFSCMGVGGWTKEGIMKAIALWAFDPD